MAPGSPSSPDEGPAPAARSNSRRAAEVDSASASEAESAAAAPPDAFAVVGIGASAGGLEAVTQLLEALPGDTGMAFVVVQHLDPKHESKLDTILAKATRMPVHEAAHGVGVEADSVYVIPPNATMTIAGGVLKLAPRGEPAVHHLPVDSFFKSLADDRQSGAIGVVLSGTGSDGTLGLEAIKANGGITFAQDQQSAKYAGMPLSAVRSGCVDVVLPPAEIARELARFATHPYVTMPPELGDRTQPSEASLRKILALLRATFGVDFTAYRDSTIRRRMARRMMLNGKEGLADYAQHLENNRAELDALYHDILISVTSFFREAETFEALKVAVFPEILKNKSPHEPLRIWVPGCSTGQEAYSIAMALIEFLDDKPVTPPIQIFATDLSDAVSLQKAREGVYPENIAAEVTPERLRRFFTKEDGKYRINKAIRDVCLFAKHNVAADPPFSRIDLISCRNLLIYLTPPLQRRVIPTFHYALNPEGFLVLGASETISTAADLFTLVDRHHRIYRKRAAALRPYPHFAVEDVRQDALPRPPRGREAESAPGDWSREADRLVLSDYSPPGALINREFEVLQFRGETGAYLKPSPGEASLNILKMAREGLFLDLKSAINEARTRKAEVRHRNIRVRGDSETRKIDLRVLPVLLAGKSEECFLVLFEDDRLRASTQAQAQGSARSQAEPRRSGRLAQWLRRLAPGEPRDLEPADAKSLRQELAATREYLQSVIEEQDAANEELKSANEEILSTNEELQSTNEELETAKEELQSVNEELTTVNEQLQTRNAELSRLNDDVSNLIASTSMPMVAVGVDLRIRRMTPAAAKLFNILPTDIGRPIGNLKPKIEIPELEAMIAEAIDTVKVQERQVRDRDGRRHVLRVHPYRTADNRIDGAVVVLLDLEEVASQAARLREKAGLLELSTDAIIARDHNSVVTFWNQGATKMYGWTADEAIGKNSHALLQPGTAAKGEEIDAVLRAHDHWQGESVHVRRDGTPIVVESRQVVQRSPGGEILAILEINRDITERKRMIDELAAADRRKNEFLATLAHELRNPLTPLRNGIQVLRLVGTDAPEAVTVRETIERNIRHMARLIDDLLDVARITHSRIELKREPVDMAAVVKEVSDELRPTAEAENDALKVHLPSGPVLVDADPVRLAQVIENLLHNAIKYTDEGEIDVALARENGNAVLRIRDTGIGISPENLGRIWEPFVQGDASLERRRSGLGLGLTLVRTLVELHGGTIAGTSAGPGKGSEFVLRLPLLTGKPAVAEPAAKPAATLTGRRLLVVDDNADAAASFASLLKLLGNEVRTAANGPEALAVAKECRPEIVLLDLGLPGMSGYDVARALRGQQDDGALTIVAVSGYGAEEDRARTKAAGFDAHFVKPMDISQLEQFLAGRRAAAPP